MSIPVLFGPDTIDFKNNGLGHLIEATRADVVEARNSDFYLSLDYPAHGFLAKDIVLGGFIQALPNNRTDEMHTFTITNIDSESNPSAIYITAISKTIVDLSDNIVEKFEMANITPQLAMTALNTRSIDVMKYEFYSNITTQLAVYWERISSLNAIVGSEGSVIDTWGGELLRENNKISLLDVRGKAHEQDIRPGKNMAGFRMTTSSRAIVTRILPYATIDVETEDGAKESQIITAPIVSSQYINNYARKPIIPVDFTGDDVTTMYELTQKSARYFTTGNPGVDKPTLSLDVKMTAISDKSERNKYRLLEDVALCDIVNVYVKKFNVDVSVKVVEVTFDSLAEINKSVKLGEQVLSPMNQMAKDTYEQIKQSEKNMEAIVVTAVSGNKIIYGGNPDPKDYKKGDVWYRRILPGNEWSLYIHDGENFIEIVSSAVFAALEQKIEDNEKAAQDAKDSADAGMIKAEQSLTVAEEAKRIAESAKQDAINNANAIFNTNAIAEDARRAAEDAIAKGDANKLLIDQTDNKLSLLTTKVDGNSTQITALKVDAGRVDLHLEELDNSFTTLEATFEGFRTTTQSSIDNLQSQQTQTAGMLDSLVIKVDNIDAYSPNILDYYDSGFGGWNTGAVKGDTLEQMKVNGSNPNRFRFNKPFHCTGTMTAKLFTSGIFEFDIYYMSDNKTNPTYMGSHSGWKRDQFTFQHTGYAVVMVKRIDNANMPQSNINELLLKIEAGNTVGPWDPNQVDTRTYSRITQLDDSIISVTSKVTSLDGKVTSQEGKITQLTDQLNLSIKRVVVVENAVTTQQGQVTILKDQVAIQTTKISEVDGKITTTEGKITVLTTDINLRVKKGEVMSQINIDANKILFDVNGNLINITPTTTYIQNATIKDAAIQTVTADKLTAGTINGNTINIINLNAANIVGINTQFVNSSWNGINNAISIDSTNLTVINTTTSKSIKLNSAGLHYYRGSMLVSKVDADGQNYYSGTVNNPRLMARTGVLAENIWGYGLINEVTQDRGFIQWINTRDSLPDVELMTLNLDGVYLQRKAFIEDGFMNTKDTLWQTNNRLYLSSFSIPSPSNPSAVMNGVGFSTSPTRNEGAGIFFDRSGTVYIRSGGKIRTI